MIACSLSGLASLSWQLFRFMVKTLPDLYLYTLFKYDLFKDHDCDSIHFEIEDIYFIHCILPASCRSHSSFLKIFSNYVSAAIDEKVSFRFKRVSKREDTSHEFACLGALEQFLS